MDVANELGELMATIVLALSPHRIVVGGGVGCGQRWLLPRIREATLAGLAGYVAAVDAASVESLIVPAGLQDDAGPLGAVAIGLDVLERRELTPPARSARRSLRREEPFRSPSSSVWPCMGGRLLHRAVGGRAGRRGGAFLTSPEVGPLFGAVLARYLDAQWLALGRPDPFTVVDAGAGPGTLARAILAAQPSCRAAMRYVAVEVSAAQRALHPADVESRDELPDGPIDGVIVANELLDNLPFRLCVFDGNWREAFVVDAGEGRFAELLSAPLDPVPVVLPSTPVLGSRAPAARCRGGMGRRARSRLRSGSLLVIDYCRPTTASMAARPWRDWLRTYRGHERGDHYLAGPGSQDITVEIALDQFPAPDAVARRSSSCGGGG